MKGFVENIEKLSLEAVLACLVFCFGGLDIIGTMALERY